VFADKDNDDDKDEDENDSEDVPTVTVPIPTKPIQVVDNASEKQHNEMLLALSKIIDKLDKIGGPTPPPCNCTEPHPQPNGTDQILIGDLISSTNFTGEITAPQYLGNYTVPKVFDNNTKVNHSWSQFGKSSFEATLKEPLKKPICNVELYVYKPKNTPYTLNLGSNIITGNLNADFIPIDTRCVEDLQKISMSFNAPDKFTTITELKLFQNVTKPGPIEPGNVFVDIRDSNATISVVNSTVKFTFDNTTVVEMPKYNVTNNEDGSLTVDGGS
jgi:hypothetical protein